MAHLPLTVLGIETSCDDTAAAVIRMTDTGTEILSNVVHSQVEDHAAFGGVVPEIAARSHVERADVIIEQALSDAKLTPQDLSAIAVTAGPGLVGGVMVGLMTAKAIALAHDLPLVPVNHLAGHALSVRLTETVAFPYLLLLVSGGHTQLLRVDGPTRFTRLGTTIDDAAGEAFDKSAKLLGLGQPGGPMIQRAALTGDASRFDFPRPLRQRAGCDFSFSGLKTALRDTAKDLLPLDEATIADLAASFQQAIAQHLIDRTEQAMTSSDLTTLVIAGGVAANTQIRASFAALTDKYGWQLVVPPVKYCTDNGAMIALAGAEQFLSGADYRRSAGPWSAGALAAR